MDRSSGSKRRPRNAYTDEFRRSVVDHLLASGSQSPRWQRKQHRTGKVYMAPFDVYLDETNAHQPDIVYVSNHNKILTPKGAVGAPEYVVEVLSPTTEHLDKKPKRRVYARTGVKEYWIIDPDTRLIHVYFLQENAEQPKATYSQTDSFTSPHFPGLQFKASEIFSE
jgi:Uma2 family endonuclease